MKKYFLSFVFIASFVIYAFYQRLNLNSNQLPASGDSGGLVALGTPTPSTVSPTPSPTSTFGGEPPITTTPNPTTVPTKSPTPTPTSKPTPVPPTPTPTPKGQYTDGTYTGSSADAYYGNIQVEAVISGGKLTDVVFLDYPQDRGTSVRINTQAMPLLKQEAIAAQSANVNGVSGATDSSQAFVQSLSSALSKAKA